MNMPENIQVIDRAWPAPKTLTREAMSDEILRDQMFREWGFTDYASKDEDTRSDLLCETLWGLWRGDFKSDEERLAYIKSAWLGHMEVWAENEAEECE